LITVGASVPSLFIMVLLFAPATQCRLPDRRRLNTI
jgi:hypothetical protein